MSFDANAHRAASLESWEEAAAGWGRRARELSEFGRPVSQWLVEAIEPQPGHEVLELAAGLGETGMLAAELVAPGGRVIVSDQAEAMLAGARARAAERGIANVSFEVLNAEWIDLPLAGLDAVLCRWGYMLMADPATALSETRRVLRPGGRVALAVWDALERNPWAALPAQALAEHSLGAPPQPGLPGPFALADPQRLLGLLEDAGFAEVRLETLPVSRRQASFAEFWETTLDISRSFHDAVLSRPEPEVTAIRATLARLLEPYTAADGTLDVPGSSHVAVAGA